MGLPSYFEIGACKEGYVVTSLYISLGPGVRTPRSDLCRDWPLSHSRLEQAWLLSLCLILVPWVEAQ